MAIANVLPFSNVQDYSTNVTTIQDSPFGMIHVEPTISPVALSLPPFSQLENDEDRELKATTRPPGTSVVVLTQQSFQNIDAEDNIGFDDFEDISSPLRDVVKIEDEDFNPVSDRLPQLNKRRLVNQIISSSPAMEADPDIVILARFEEPVTKPLSLTPTTTSSTGRRLSVASIRSTGQSSIATSKSSPQIDEPKSLPKVAPKQEHIQIQLPFALPDYSLIAAADTKRPNLSQQHLSQLRSLLFERVLLTTSGATPFIIWYMVAIDVVGSLAGVDNGDITESFLSNSLVTDFKRTFASSSPVADNSIFPSPTTQTLENQAFLQALSLNQELILLGSTIAKTRFAFKTAAPLSAEYTGEALSESEIQASVRESQVQQIIEELQRRWIFHQNGMANLATGQNSTPSTRVAVLQSQVGPGNLRFKQSQTL
ncbi:hypothetical protein ABW20_dc0107953 [Dactylellina cionopaga]|nr:hypothetical protein ABW20_dc0107953 [Dactylellina cionopaga]